MDKASRVIRRSGVKLLSMGGHSDLNMMISEVKDIRTSAKAFMQAQHLTSQDMLRWSSHEDNRAIQDVVSQIAELSTLWTDVQRDFIEHLKEFRQMFEMILTGQKHVSQAKSNLMVCEQKEQKVRKELKGAAKRASPAEIRIFEHRLSQAQRTKELAQVEVSDRVRENESVKLIRLKEGLLKFTESYIEMATKCSILFSTEREVALQLPDVHGRDLEDVKYTGSDATKFFVQEARGKLMKYRSNSCSSSTSGDTMNDPPPPYTPPDPIVTDTPRPALRTSLPTRIQDMEHSTRTSLPDYPGNLDHSTRTSLPDYPGNLDHSTRTSLPYYPGNMDHSTRTSLPDYPGNLDRSTRTSLPDYPGNMDHSTRTSLPDYPRDQEHSMLPARRRSQTSGSFSSTQSDNSSHDVPIPRPNSEHYTNVADRDTTIISGQFSYNSTHSDTSTNDGYTLTTYSEPSTSEHIDGHHHNTNLGNSHSTPKPHLEHSTIPQTQNTGKISELSVPLNLSKHDSQIMNQNSKDRPNLPLDDKYSNLPLDGKHPNVPPDGTYPNLPPGREYLRTPQSTQEGGGNVRPRQLHPGVEQDSVHEDEYSTADEETDEAAGGVDVR